MNTDFLEDALKGLSASPKYLPSKYFYDRRGSDLFVAITRCKDYYIPRAETSVLQDYSSTIAGLLGAKRRVVEFGAGEAVKTEILLKALPEPLIYMPLDIDEETLKTTSERFSKRFPALITEPKTVDFTKTFSLPPAPEGFQDLFFYPGSTLGNFTPDEAAVFLKHLHDLGREGTCLLIGVDSVKDTAILERAYNDKDGITADFNKNILQRLKTECGADFNLDDFSHYAFYNREDSRIEMHLISQKRQNVHLAGHDFSFEKNESILTEYSYKYTPESFETLCEDAGWTPQHRWSDRENLFHVYLCVF